MLTKQNIHNEGRENLTLFLCSVLPLQICVLRANCSPMGPLPYVCGML